MAKYMSGNAAVNYYNIPDISVALGYSPEKDGFDDYTVTSRNERHKVKGQRIHLCTIPLPKDAVVTRYGKDVSSPELLFLEFANKLPLRQLILFGMQLCSHYDSAIILTTTKKITSFVNNTPGYRGRSKALRALKYIKDGAASVMESLLYMMLTLPNRLGGCGFPPPELNYRVKLKEDGRRQLKRKNNYTDLYYKNAKVVVEYNSYKFHKKPKSQSADGIRSEVLTSQGLTVKHLATYQFYNPDTFWTFAKNLAKLLKKRLRVRSKHFTEEHRLLRELFPQLSYEEQYAI